MYFNFGGGGGMGGGARGGAPPKPAAPIDNTKFYTLLGVAKDADQAEIKKAYRQAALKHHPDRGGNAETFKEISRAHEVLSDPQTRALYDEGGEEAVTRGSAGGGAGAGPPGMDLFDLFGMFGGGGGARRGQKKKGEDVVFPLKVGLDDLYNGTSKKLRLTKNVICSACKGKGGKNGADSTCQPCRGQGMTMSMRQVGPGMIQQVPMKCTSCKGTGSQIADKDKCNTCQGACTVKEKKTLEVQVFRGMKHGERIIYRGEADEAPGTESGDVVVVLQMVDHPTFRREGSSLFMKKTITLIEALTGFNFQVTCLDGRVLRVQSEAGMIVKPGQIKCIRDEGMPLSKPGHVTRGDLFVELDVTFPQPGELDEKALRSLSAILPRPVKEVFRPSVAPPGADLTGGKATLQPYYEVALEKVDMAKETAKQAQQDAQEREGEEQDSDDGASQQRAQPGCQQQ